MIGVTKTAQLLFHLRLTRQHLLGVALLTSFMVVGCSDGKGVRVPVSGLVTVDGEVLRHGSVRFNPVATGADSENTRAGGGALDENGRFQVSCYTAFDGLPPGTYDVSITATEPINDTSQRWHAPKKYSKTDTAGLQIEITETTDACDFDLTWDGNSPSKPYVERGL